MALRLGMVLFCCVQKVILSNSKTLVKVIYEIWRKRKLISKFASERLKWKLFENSNLNDSFFQSSLNGIVKVCWTKGQISKEYGEWWRKSFWRGSCVQELHGWNNASLRLLTLKPSYFKIVRIFILFLMFHKS